MKPKTAFIRRDIVYLAVMTLCSVYYVLADYSKSESRGLGFLQFVFPGFKVNNALCLLTHIFLLAWGVWTACARDKGKFLSGDPSYTSV